MAKEVAVRAFEAYQKRFVDYRPTMQWTGDKDARIEFNVKGLKLQGSIGIRRAPSISTSTFPSCFACSRTRRSK